MADFLEHLDVIESEASGLATMFSAREDGIRPRSRFANNASYKQKLAQAVTFIKEVASGRRPAYQLREVMTTDDFPLLFGDILDRSVLAEYVNVENTWEKVAKRATVADFRDAKIYPPTWGADGVLEDVREAAPYPDAAVYEQTPITWNVKKFGRKVPFSWESMINDDLDMLKNIPRQLGRAARRTENDMVSRLYVDVNGPHASMYTSGNENQIITANGALTNNPPLGIAGLQDAYTVLASMLGENGDPIVRDAITLVVPPALEITALNILNATEIRATRLQAGGQPGADTDGYQELGVANWMRNKLTLVVDPYIPAIASTANGNRSWFLFANPNSSREAIRIGFLRGHESPEIWMKSPNAVRVGGGAVSPMDGDFDTDSITYRIRHVIGVTRIDPKATVASNGSGS